jgi:hypothetical protein
LLCTRRISPISSWGTLIKLGVGDSTTHNV